MSDHRILVTGKGTAGAWKIRGVQLGSRLGKVKHKATLKDCNQADQIIVVKRINAPFFEHVKASGKPWIWDLIDFYPQPECSTWSKEQAIEWVKNEVEQAKPNGIIWPNCRMKKDCKLDGEVIYHHARPKQALNPIRDKIQLVGYEGAERYLGKWRGIIKQECKRRGWKFLINVPLDQLDIVIAVRDDPHNGYVQRHWKSNVKLANAHATGTPFVGQAESGYLETCSGKERWLITEKSLGMVFDELEPVETRKAIHNEFVKNTITVDECAARLRDYARRLFV